MADDILLTVVEGLTPEVLEQLDWSVGERLFNEAIRLNFLGPGEQLAPLGTLEIVEGVIGGKVKTDVEGQTFTLRRWNWGEKSRFRAKRKRMIDSAMGKTYKVSDMPEDVAKFINDLLLDSVEGLTPAALEQLDWKVKERLFREAERLNFFLAEKR